MQSGISKAVSTPFALAELLTLAVQRGASDLHLSAGLPPLLRVDGELSPLDAAPLSPDDVLTLLDGSMDSHQRATHAARRECDFAFDIPGLARCRANVFWQARGPSAALRLLTNTLPTLDVLTAPEVIRKLLDTTHGLILTTGPTGSGKSTTLAAMLDHLNRTRHAHILTIEDPIEFIHSPRKCLIQQREIGRETESFHSGLRAALREDPDVILVGELRDADTIALALTAAETGHLVLASLHTGSAAKAVDRMIDAFPAGDKPMVRSMLSETLRAVIAQVLPRRIGGGRVAAWEVLRGTPAVANLIREDKLAQMVSAIQSGQRHGMQTLAQSLQNLVDAGQIAADEAQRYSRPGIGI